MHCVCFPILLIISMPNIEAFMVGAAHRMRLFRSYARCAIRMNIKRNSVPCVNLNAKDSLKLTRMVNA